MATKLHWCDVSPCWLIYFFVRPTLVRNGIEYYNHSKDYKPLSDIQTYYTYSITFKCILDKGLYLWNLNPIGEKECYLFQKASCPA